MVRRNAAVCGEHAAGVLVCDHNRAYVTLMLCVGVILNPANPVSATPACISVWNSTNAIPGLASTMRTSAYLITAQGERRKRSECAAQERAPRKLLEQHRKHGAGSRFRQALNKQNLVGLASGSRRCRCCSAAFCSRPLVVLVFARCARAARGTSCERAGKATG